MPDEFFTGTDWQASSGPVDTFMWDEADLWPMGARSGSGTKDALVAGETPAKHPAIAIGGMTTADGRPENRTGVVVAYEHSTNLVTVNWANGFIIRQYVANILSYSGVTAAVFEQAPVIGQPVYVDPSDDLSDGVTLSLSPLDEDGAANPLWGHLMYCQTETQDGEVGGPNADAQWPLSWANELTETEVCVMHASDSGQACCDVAQ